MAIKYVDSNAAGTGDGSSWANAYPDVYSGLTHGTNAIAANDDVYIASNHSYQATANNMWTVPDGVSFYSVNSTTGVFEQATAVQERGGTSGSTLDINIAIPESSISLHGVYLDARDDIMTNGTSHGGKITYKDSTLNFGRASGSGNSLQFLGDGVESHLVNVDIIKGTHDSQRIFITSGGKLVMDNCYSTGANKFTTLLNAQRNGGANVLIKNSDLESLLDVTSGYLINAVTADADRLQIELFRCKLPTGWDSTTKLFTSTPAVHNYQVDIIACDTGSGYHYFYHENYFGVVEENTATYLNATYDGANGFSTELNPSANSSIGNPLRHKLCSFPAKKLGANKEVKINFTCADTLSDSEFWLDVVHNDATDNALGNTVSTRATDILSAGTTQDAGDAWTLGGLANEYSDTATLTGAPTEGIIDVYVNLACDGVTLKDVWVDPAPVLS